MGEQGFFPIAPGTQESSPLSWWSALAPPSRVSQFPPSHLSLKIKLQSLNSCGEIQVWGLEVGGGLKFSHLEKG